MKRLLSLILVVGIMFSIAVGCNKNTDNVNPNDSETPRKDEKEEDKKPVETETGDYILKNSETTYKIVLPETAKRNEILAAEEFTNFFSESTGVYLDVVRDAGITYSADSKYLSIGDTQLAKQAGISVTKEDLGEQGYIIKTVGKSMFFLGATEFGTLYSVYEFFGTELNYEYFAPDIYSIDKNVKNIPLREYNEKSIPDIESFAPNYGALMGATNVTARYRMTGRDVTAMKINGNTSVHNELLILPIESYGEEHPKWYTNWKETVSGYQYEENLCLTAHGDKDEYALMVDALCREIYDEFKGGSTGKFLIFGQMDGAPACECKACAANTLKYGAKSATAILFLNDVLKKVYEWYETKEGSPYKRDFYINLLAYQTYEDAPVTYNAQTDSFTVNGDLEIHNKIGFVMAPIKYDFGMLSDDPKNAPMYRNMRAWATIGHSCMFYTYDFNTRNYLVPYESLTSKQELYRLMKESNCLHLYDQGQWLNSGLATGWSMLKLYVATKLRWNVDLNVNDLVYKYFQGVYGEAGDIMREAYYKYRSYWADIREKAKTGANGIQAIWVNYLSGATLKRELWSHSYLVDFLDYYDRAFAAIESLKKEDGERYSLIARSISMERVSTLYTLLSLYSDRYTKKEIEGLLETLENDAKSCKMSETAESGGQTIREFIESVRAK